MSFDERTYLRELARTVADISELLVQQERRMLGSGTMA